MNLKELIKSIPDLDGERDCAVIAANLNERPTIPNPITEAPLVPKPIHNFELFGLALADPATAVKDQAVLGKVAELIKLGTVFSGHVGTNNQGNLAGLIDLAVQQGLSKTSAERLRKRVAETIPDPSWQTTIQGESLAGKNGLGVVSISQVVEVLHGGA